MEFTNTLCESCKIFPATTPDYNNTENDYKICLSCRDRLMKRTLRPLEFFNLVAIHGETNELHDDFYDYDTGEATQPSAEVERPEDFPFPSLEETSTNLEKVVDFACVEYFTKDDTIRLISTFDKQKVLDYLKYKVNYNRSINYKCYEIAAKTLHAFARNWIREQWDSRMPKELALFASALSACLPLEEAFESITMELEVLKGNVFNEESLALCHLASNKTLGWIEKNQSKIINVSSNWGTIAARSQFNWATAQRWLNDGRPLSLIALDALYYCITNPERNWPFGLKENPPILTDFPGSTVIADSVNEYLIMDNTPRTKEVCLGIIKNLSTRGNLNDNK